MMARFYTATVIYAAALLSACAQTEETPTNPYLENVMNITSPMANLRFKRFGSASGWVIWYFQTDFGAKCVGTKPAESEAAAVPQAVFVRQTTGDLRVDIWLDEGDVIIRIPVLEDGMNLGTRGYYRAPGTSFFRTIDFGELKSIANGQVELRSEAEFVRDGLKNTLELTGIDKAEKLLRACDRSVPAH
jgi:hypothetical protein